jgi:hypothetical protein
MVVTMNDDFFIPKILPAETSAAEAELLEIIEDYDIQMMHTSPSTVEFWKLVSETNCMKL